VGSLIVAPSLFVLIMHTQSLNKILFWIITTIAITSLCLSWTIVTNIIINVIQPTKRSFAFAINMMITCLLGDAISPYVIGLLSDIFKNYKKDKVLDEFSSLQLALYIVPLMSVFSTASYFLASFYLVEDKKLAECLIKSNLFKIFLYF
jgi:MFS transporter, Spinster family, sphingosine-1-phosphate transporter